MVVASMRILFVTAYPPIPATYGGSVRVSAILSRLAARHEVHLLTFVEGEATAEQREALSDMCASVGFVTREQLPAARRRWYYLAHTFSGPVPPYVAAFDSDEMRNKMRDRIASGIDVVQLEWTQMAQYCLPEAAARTALTEHDIFFQSLELYAASESDSVTRAVRARRAAQMKAWELSALAGAGGIFTVSDADRDVLGTLLPAARVATVPSGAALDYYTLDPRASVLTARRCDRFVFVGGLAHEPNLDGLTWFAHEVLPLVRKTIPSATLDVLGGDVAPEVRSAAGPGVRFRGFVDDTRPYLRAAITVVPIRLGAGVRMKILEAMAAGSPVVATTHGASGLAVRAGEHLLIADDAPVFADTLVRLASDSINRTGLARAARTLVEEHYGWDAIVKRQESLYEEWFGQPAAVGALAGWPQPPGGDRD